MYPMMYPNKHGSNIPYHPLYSNYSSHHVPSHHQFMNGSPQNGILDSDAASVAYFNPHPGLYQSSPEWNHDNFPTSNAQLFTNGGHMTPSSSLHVSPTLLSSHHAMNNSNGNNENLHNGLPNIPPSPPITVNSGCSELSSPGIASNGMNSTIGNGDASPSSNNNNNISRPKSPYEWIKKQSYQCQPNPGMCFLLFFGIIRCSNFNAS